MTTPRRSSALPDIPAIGESVPGFEITHCDVKRWTRVVKEEKISL